MPQNKNDKIGADFDRMYAEVVAEAMSALGEGTSVITNYLEQKYSISLADTADNPQALSEALGSALDGGARIIQRRILRLLYERMNIKNPLYMTIDFEKRILEVRKMYERLGSSSSPSRNTG
jgi:hypothetical protein